MQDPGRIHAPSTVREGGSITIEVRTGADSVFVSILGRSRVRVPVRNGVAEYRLPPSVQGGTVIFISDCQLPEPASTAVTVVGNP